MKKARFKFSLTRETKFVGIGILILFCAMLVFEAVIRQFNFSVVLGSIIGCVYSFLNFFMLELSIKSVVVKTEEQAKKVAVRNYFLRSIVTILFIFVCFKVKSINVFSAVIPLLFPKFILLFGGITGLIVKEGNKNERT